MGKPLISIITPTYNQERFIGACIESALEQTYHDWEMLVVDDGSTDATLDIVRRYKDERVRVFPQPHRGIWKLYETYNTALAESRGILVGVLEGDDLWPPERLEKQVPHFNDERVVLVFGRAKIIGENGWARDPFESRSKQAIRMINRSVGTALKELLTTNVIPASTVLLKREALQEIGGFQQPPGLPTVDYATWLNLALVGEFRFVNEPMGIRRIHLGATTAQQRVEQEETAGRYALEFFRRLTLDLQDQTQLTERDLARFAELRVARGHMEAGRYCLVRGERVTARQHFGASLQGGDFTTRLLGILGVACSLTGVSMEMLARRAGRMEYQ